MLAVWSWGSCHGAGQLVELGVLGGIWQGKRACGGRMRPFVQFRTAVASSAWLYITPKQSTKTSAFDDS